MSTIKIAYNALEHLLGISQWIMKNALYNVQGSYSNFILQTGLAL
jgi:hypothetical protein